MGAMDDLVDAIGAYAQGATRARSGLEATRAQATAAAARLRASLGTCEHPNLVQALGWTAQAAQRMDQAMAALTALSADLEMLAATAEGGPGATPTSVSAPTPQSTAESASGGDCATQQEDPPPFDPQPYLDQMPRFHSGRASAPEDPRQVDRWQRHDACPG